MSTTAHLATFLLCVLSLLAGPASPLLADDLLTSVPLLAQGDGGGIEVAGQSRYYVVEGVVVGGLVIGALFVICKSSRRT